MPVYEYKCQDHGLFYELATLEEAGEPVPCPHCQTLSPRIILVPPEILDMAPSKRDAITKNEQAQHEPQMSTLDSRAENAEKLKHGCGCQYHKKGKSKLMYTADGNKMFPSMRPWMISH